MIEISGRAMVVKKEIFRVRVYIENQNHMPSLGLPSTSTLSYSIAL